MSLGGNMAGLLSGNRVLSTQIGFDEQRITVRPVMQATVRPAAATVSRRRRPTTIKLTKTKIDWHDFVIDDLM